MPTPEVRAWERQDDEPEGAYEAFKGYVYQTPPRRMLHASVKHSSSELSDLFNEWCWRERALAYDRHIQSIRDTERESLLKQDEKERFAKMLAVLEGEGEILMREVGKLLRDSQKSQVSGLLKPSELIKLTTAWITLQRLIHGESTSNVGVVDTSLERLSIEEVRELQRLQAKMTGDAEDGTETEH
jgi:hypothetical protein